MLQQSQNISFMSVFFMLFMIRTYLTAKCSQSLSMLRSVMLKSIKLLQVLWSLWSLWSFDWMFRAWDTSGGKVANSNSHCSAVSTVWGGANVSGIGAALWCFKGIQLREPFKWFLFNCSAEASFNGIERHTFGTLGNYYQCSYFCFSRRKDQGRLYQ